MERVNRNLLASLRVYVVEHPRTWDMYTDAVTYDYHTHVNQATALTPFGLV